jgi:hypothetical protein
MLPVEWRAKALASQLRHRALASKMRALIQVFGDSPMMTTPESRKVNSKAATMGSPAPSGASNSHRNPGGPLPRLCTGVEGFDDILNGGIPSGHLYLVEGDPGTGLGLWVTGEIIRRNGWTIRVRSRCGPRKAGTVFSIAMPLSHAATRALAEEAVA